MQGQGHKTRLEILRALHELQEPAGAARITRHLGAGAAGLQPRTIRLYLQELDRAGLTAFVSRRRGRTITERGRAELARENVPNKVGFVATRIDGLACRTSFDPETDQGNLMVDRALIHKSHLLRAIEDMKPVFQRRLTMSDRIAVYGHGESAAGLPVPRDTVALCTVCAMTLDGLLLAKRIPVTSRFGGVLEINDGRPMRFVELIDYQGTTAAPAELYIKADITRVREAARTGTGLICASFAEIPALVAAQVHALAGRLRQQRLMGPIAIGRPGQPLLDVPVGQGRVGLLVYSGLNPFAAIRETGAHIDIETLAGVEDVTRFSPFSLLRDRLPG